VSFSIKCLYTWPNVVEITIYHKTHTQIDGSFAHGEHYPESISLMSHYVPHMSQALKDHIWAQLSLGYTTKQTYDKHRAIWWEHVNAVKAWHKMISFSFKTLHIWIGNIRNKVSTYTLTLQFQFSLGFSNIQRMYFFPNMLMKSMGFKSHSP
jgi:hypothetical protein